MILRLAWRGAVKHYRRSLVVIGAVAVACAVMVNIGGLLNGISDGFYASVIHTSGHVRLRSADAADALDPFGLEALVKDYPARLAALAALGDDRIVAAEPILGFGALLIGPADSADSADAEASADSGGRNLALRMLGVLPDTRFADDIRSGLTAGAFLPEGGGLVISEGAAALIGAELGSGVVVLVRDASGQPWYQQLEVTGLFRTASADFDESTAYVAHATAEQLLDTAGATREIRIELADRGAADAFAANLRAAWPDAGLEILSWRTINAATLSLLLFLSILLDFVMSLFAVVAGTIIANTVLMSVLERLREFGTMRAIGLRARSLRALILAEGAILAVAGAVLGLGVGALAAWWIGSVGIDLGGLMEDLGMARINRPKLEAASLALYALVAAGVGILASLGAARRLGRRTVADSLTGL